MCGKTATWNLFQTNHPVDLRFQDGVQFFCPYVSACDEHKGAMFDHFDVDEPEAIEPKYINPHVQCSWNPDGPQSRIGPVSRNGGAR